MDTDKLTKALREAAKHGRIPMWDGRHPIWSNGFAQNALILVAVVPIVLMLTAKTIKDGDEVWKSLLIALIGGLVQFMASWKIRHDRKCGGAKKDEEA